jgi:MYXO-CTERM domain-containing protein
MVRTLPRALALATGVAIASVPAIVGAVRAPEHLAHRPQFEVADGPAVRQGRDVRWDAPADFAGVRALARFMTSYGHGWRVLYDDQTNVPLRIYGQGIPVPGSVADPDIAERAARQVFADQLELLAPGTNPNDFVTRVNDGQPDWNMRTIAFAQTIAGMPVIGAEVTFTFKNDRLFVLGSTVVPNLGEHLSKRTVSDAAAVGSASAWVLSDVAKSVSQRGEVEGPFVLPLVWTDGTARARSVVRVTLDADPIGRWWVYVDATTGAVVAREQKLMFATATVNYDVPDRYPQKGRINKPARGADLGGGIIVGADGKISFTGTAANLTIKCISSFVKVVNKAGAALSAQATVTDGQTLNFSRAMTEFDDAQLQTFVSTGIIKARMKFFRPQLTWLDQSINATVNENQSCNAYSDGTNVTFFRKGSSQGLTCENTGRILDVTMHEVGHSFHQHVITSGQFEGALSEGISDYFAVDITEDPGMGKGFFANTPDEALRDCDTTPEATWPSNAEIHIKGIIIAGALWDARKNFKAAMGQAGADKLGKEFADALARAVDIPSMYTEILASDDDDGNINNGTPNKCLIDEAFGRHNLAEPGADTGPGVKNPTLAGMHITVPVTGGTSAACPGKQISGATVEWKVRGNDAMKGSLNMAKTAAGYEADLPAPGDSIVLNYKVTVTFADNTKTTFPDNAADPFYELYIGQVDKIFCTDFETDPYANGWTHALVAGTAGSGADDWMWSTPAGTAGSGDPNGAVSGTKAIGNDLGGTVGGQQYNGLYQASKTNQTVSPVIDLMGHTQNVRLQYKRWLNVEDAAKDKGTILVDGQARWVNTGTGNNHTDREWRFHDVDLTADAADGKVQVTFQLASDAGGNFGGWTIDDFCIVASKVTNSVCGNGTVEAGEGCDDGNKTDGDGCSSTCMVEVGDTCGNGAVDPGEQCDDGNTTGGDGCSANCTSEDTTGPVCGNGVVEGSEECDDGNADNTDACKSTCVKNTPGDPGTPDDGDASGDCGCRAGGEGSAPAGSLALLFGVALGFGLVRRRRTRR